MTDTCHILINAISVAIYLGLGIWELAVAATVHVPTRDLDDMIRCFLITMCVFNLLTGTILLGFTVRYCFQEGRAERVSFNVSTGISIWGIVLYFRYADLCNAYFYYVLLAETFFFLSRVLLLVCLSCIEHNRSLFPLQIELSRE